MPISANMIDMIEVTMTPYNTGTGPSRALAHRDVLGASSLEKLLGF